MPTDYYQHVKRKSLLAVAAVLLVMAALFYWHSVDEYRVVSLAEVSHQQVLDSWHASIYLQVVIGVLLVLFISVLTLLFLRLVKKLESANLQLISQQDELRVKAELLDSALDAILLLDEKGGLLQFNNALCNLTGRSRAELEGMKIQNFMPPEKLPGWKSASGKFLSPATRFLIRSICTYQESPYRSRGMPNRCRSASANSC